MGTIVQVIIAVIEIIGAVCLIGLLLFVMQRYKKLTEAEAEAEQVAEAVEQEKINKQRINVVVEDALSETPRILVNQLPQNMQNMQYPYPAPYPYASYAGADGSMPVAQPMPAPQPAPVAQAAPAPQAEPARRLTDEDIAMMMMVVKAAAAQPAPAPAPAPVVTPAEDTSNLMDVIAKQNAMIENLMQTQQSTAQVLSATQVRAEQAMAAATADYEYEDDEDEDGVYSLNKVRPPRPTLDEQLAKLSEQQHKFFDEIYAWISGNENVKETKSKYKISFHFKAKPLVKLFVKKNTTTISFMMEDEKFRQLRRTATMDDVQVKPKATEVLITDETALSIAQEAIIMKLEQIEEDIQYAKELQKEKRRAKRAEAKAHESETGEGAAE